MTAFANLAVEKSGVFRYLSPVLLTSTPRNMFLTLMGTGL